MHCVRFQAAGSTPAALWATAIALGWCAIFSGRAADVRSASERRDFADGLYARGLHDLAVREYVALLQDFPALPEADAVRFRLAESQARLGHTEHAILEFERVFLRFTNSAFRCKAGFRRGELLIQAGRTQEAIHAFQSLLQSQPPDDLAAAAWYRLGEQWAQTGRVDAAAAAWNEVRQRYPHSPFYAYAALRLGELYAGSAGAPSAEDAQRAMAYLAEAAQTGVARVAAEAEFQLAELLARRGAFAQSVEHYRRLLSAWPEDPRARETPLRAAWAEYRAGFFAEALTLAERALPQTADALRAEWLYLKANSERELLQSEAAVRTYAALLDRHSDSRFANAARFERAFTLYQMGRLSEALAEAVRVRKDPALTARLYWLLAECHAALHHSAEAIQYYRLIVSEFPTHALTPDARYRVAHHLQEHGQFRQAAEQYYELATVHSNHPLAASALLASGLCRVEANEDAEAVRDLATLIRQYPDAPGVETALHQKALAEMRLHRDADALHSWEQLLQRFPKSPFLADAQYGRGVLLDVTGRSAEAEQAYRSSLKANPREDLRADIQLRLACLLKKQGKEADAAEILTGLLADPSRAAIPFALLQWLAEYHYRRQKYDGCVAAGRTLAERAREPALIQTGWALAGRGYWAKGDRKAAVEAFSNAMAVPAKTEFGAEAALRIGEIALELQDFKKAMDWFRQAAELAADDARIGIRARAYAGLGMAAKRAGQWDTAVRFLMSVPILFETADDDAELIPRCLYEAAEVFQKLGRQTEADEVLKELAARFPSSPFAKKIEAK